MRPSHGRDIYIYIDMYGVWVLLTCMDTPDKQPSSLASLLAKLIYDWN